MAASAVRVMTIRSFEVFIGTIRFREPGVDFRRNSCRANHAPKETMAKNPDGGLSNFLVPDVEIVAEPRQMQALVVRAAHDSRQRRWRNFIRPPPARGLRPRSRIANPSSRSLADATRGRATA